MHDPDSPSCLTIVLAAGEGTRMRSRLPKVMHLVAGLPMVSHVLETATQAGGEAVAVVVGNNSQMVSSEVARQLASVQVFEQEERLGTGHAVLAASDAIEHGYDDVVVLYGDVPLTRPETIGQMRQLRREGADMIVLGFRTQNPAGYGRLIEKDGKLVAIREHNDASEAERAIEFCNGGIMVFGGKYAMRLLNSISNDNAKGEYYLTDLVEIACAEGLNVVALEADKEEILGVNNRAELAQVEMLWQQRTRRSAMLDGVTLLAPDTVFFHHDSVVENEVTIEQNVVFGPGVTVRSEATIRAFSHLEGAIVESNVVVGPYARLRPGTHLKKGSKVGNFCEVKNAVVEEGAKINHLSYVGDAHVGEKANIGAGTITCNYDGINKHRTEIGRGAFIGSNSSLVAPITIGNGAYVASGSVITEDIPDDALGIARGKQTIKTEYANEIRKRNEALKANRK